MKRLGYFFLAFIPFIIVEIMQIVSLLYLYGISAIFNLGSFNDLLYDANFSTMVMVIYTLITICLLGIIYYCFFGGEYISNVKSTFHPLIAVGVAVIVPGAQFLSNYICSFIYVLTPDVWDSYVELMESSGLDDVNFLVILYAVILGPICEELIFRGVTLRCFRCAVPFWIANICQAVLFGVFHMNIVQGIYAAVLGLILGYVCEKSGHIYYSMFLHILFNFWGTIISMLLEEISSTVFTELLIFIMTIISLIAGFILFNKGIAARDNTNTNNTQNNLYDGLSSF